MWYTIDILLFWQAERSCRHSGGQQSLTLRIEIPISAHILAINDDQAILDLYTVALEGEGYTVSTALMVSEDAREIAKLMPDLIILDFKMGKHNTGILMLEQIRMYRPTKDIPVIICTAALKEIREQEDVLLQKGIPVLYKPFDLDEFLHLVKKMVALQVSYGRE